MEVEEPEEIPSVDLQSLLQARDRQLDDLKSRIQALYLKAFGLSQLDLGNQNLLRAQNESSTFCNCICHKKTTRQFSDVETQTFESDFIDQDSTQSALDWTTEDNTKVSDLVREVVESQNSQNDYVYDETYRMYYSASTGYYYDTERNLLYDPRSQAYYKYDSTKNAYEIYDCENCVQNMDSSNKGNDLTSEDIPENGNSCKKEKKKTLRKLCKTRTQRTKKESAKAAHNVKDRKVSGKTAVQEKFESPLVLSEGSSTEEGEIHSDSSLSDDSDQGDVQIAEEIVMHEGSCEKWPPCIRAVVKESSSQKVGDVIIITCDGGIIGREETNAYCIPDISVSRKHAKILFNDETWEYGVIDLNSQNGTLVNGAPLHGEWDDAYQALHHGDILSLGSCKLLLHIHVGSNTCNECEPGIVQATVAAEELASAAKFKTKKDKEQERRQNVKDMKKKFGLKDMDFELGETFSFSNYQDRSQIRRKQKGSQNPYEKDEHPTSLETALPSSNKGYKMLQNMGWTEGHGLGSNDSGMIEPVNPWYQSGKAGLGSEPPPPPTERASESRRSAKWKKAQRRYRDIESGGT